MDSAGITDHILKTAPFRGLFLLSREGAEESPLQAALGMSNRFKAFCVQAPALPNLAIVRGEVLP